ncbi:alternative ribosome rescue aminoacyl-tRNA hydrolase ArfB [Acanthopleuribacter pedis]|uniref:Aminoacyl-tRNA hydrolase n=1 Tax=Acanthopleuribacter pedis TaxID=442870 RepID=A0A8J7QL10_9BACT|nr:alternative ribosome rescue aminoacyl-tRNA hydrolase ArfB [Acanthopleuribacter pedis]MBO1323036.1 aminoacyl-tRNA hydrolase [Acanthopleuribacter pedis]
MIQITERIAIHPNEIQEEFMQASGPGGQHVNKVASSVRLRFNVGESSLPPFLKQRLLASSDQRLTAEGVLVITSQRFRSQFQNREDALSKLVSIIRSAAKPPRRRVKTKPSRGAKERRLNEKKKRSAIKKGRSGRFSSDD